MSPSLEEVGEKVPSFHLMTSETLLGEIEAFAQVYPELDPLARVEHVERMTQVLKALYRKRAMVNSQNTPITYGEFEVDRGHGDSVVVRAKTTGGQSLTAGCVAIIKGLQEIMRRHPLVFRDNYPPETLRRWMEEANAEVRERDGIKTAT